MILKLGSGVSALDVSEYVESGYNIQTQPITQTDYTTIDGNEHTTYLGVRYIISANLGNVPAAFAAQIMGKFADGMSITFGFPTAVTAIFRYPQVTSTMITEGSESGTSGEYWDIKLNAVSEPVLNGL